MRHVYKNSNKSSCIVVSLDVAFVRFVPRSLLGLTVHTLSKTEFEQEWESTDYPLDQALGNYLDFAEKNSEVDHSAGLSALLKLASDQKVTPKGKKPHVAAVERDSGFRAVHLINSDWFNPAVERETVASEASDTQASGAERGGQIPAWMPEKYFYDASTGNPAALSGEVPSAQAPLATDVAPEIATEPVPEVAKIKAKAKAKVLPVTAVFPSSPEANAMPLPSSQEVPTHGPAALPSALDPAVVNNPVITPAAIPIQSKEKVTMNTSPPTTTQNIEGFQVAVSAGQVIVGMGKPSTERKLEPSDFSDSVQTIIAPTEISFYVAVGADGLLVHSVAANAGHRKIVGALIGSWHAEGYTVEFCSRKVFMGHLRKLDSIAKKNAEASAASAAASAEAANASGESGDAPSLDVGGEAKPAVYSDPGDA